MQLCDYGCGKEATHQFKNGKWCCSLHSQLCPVIREKNSKTHTGKKFSKEHIENMRKSQLGKIISNETKKKMSAAQTGKKGHNYGKPLSEKTKKKMSITKKGKLTSEETKKKLSISHFGKKNHMYGKKHSEETKNRIRKSKKITINEIQKKYPFFFKVEKIRYNPDKPIEEREIQVHCKNHNCLNSKEKGGWFTPTYIQLYERIRALETEKGSDGTYFYCSQKCKDECPLYNLYSDPLQKTNKLYTQDEYQAWKNKVKELDDSKCQICESTENIHVHHIIPQKLEPFFALDPINGICLCKECHYKYGHKDECSTSNIAHKQCNNMR